MPATPVAPDDPVSLAADLRIALGTLRRRLRAQGGFGDLSGAQLAVISRLDRDGPATLTTLARGLAMRPQSMGAHVAVLESHGLVQRRPDPADGRQLWISLSDVARAELARHRTAREDWLARRIADVLSVAERADLARATTLLDRIAAA